jgi:hypothetical protein|tara:strand:- start:474 stop:764 length:291 start_codon:yes stop_codon:yes gene_type:complete
MFEEKNINLVISQTNYDRETAIKKLEVWDGDYIKVIKEYLNPNFNKKKPEKKISNNQKVMKSIRNFMDDVYMGYMKRKENQNKTEENNEKIQNQKI